MRERIQVIIPALDEEATIGGVVAALRAQGLTRIRVVDNGSRDATAARAREAGAEVVVEPRRGYGQACWTGYQDLAEEVSWVLFCDADGSDEPGDVARLIAAAEAGADFVVGDRRARPENRRAMTPVQHFGNGLATTLMRWGWGRRYGDLGPLRLIRRSLLERIGMEDRGFGWTIEMQVRAVEEGARIVELPVGYGRRRGGRSKISGTIKGSVQAGTIILATLGRLAWRRDRAATEARAWSAGAMVLAGAALVMPWGDFAVPGHVRWFLVAAAVMAAGYVASWRVSRVGAGWFWLVAAAARLLLLPMTPGDDVWRYVWEGRIQVAGFSPYLHAPADPLLATWRDAGWALINHAGHATIYPPLAQLVFHAMAWIGGGVVGLKLLFVAAELATVALLARRFGRGATLVYGWNPLVIYCGAGGAHAESLFVAAMVAGWMVWERRERVESKGTESGVAESGVKPDPHVDPRRGWGAAWLWLGVSVGLKWVSAPVIAWMAWRERRHWQRALAGVALAALPLGLALAWFDWRYGRIGPLMPREFVEVARGMDVVPWLATLVWPESYYGNAWIVPAFAPVAAWVFFRARSLAGFMEAFWLSLLLFLPSVHAWYFTWLMPWAVASRNAGARWVAVSAFVYFWVWDGVARGAGWQQSPAERALVWLPLIIGWAWSRGRRAAA